MPGAIEVNAEECRSVISIYSRLIKHDSLFKVVCVWNTNFFPANVHKKRFIRKAFESLITSVNKLASVIRHPFNVFICSVHSLLMTSSRNWTLVMFIIAHPQSSHFFCPIQGVNPLGRCFCVSVFIYCRFHTFSNGKIIFLNIFGKFLQFP